MWRTPPAPTDLQAALEPLTPAFNLDGDGPRFLQESGLDGDANPIESLLIDTPGANGQRKNSDVLTHRNRYPALSLPAAAMALYTLQTFAPTGGAGNRTSLRGGGPFTALVIPSANDGEPPVALWRKLWTSVGLYKDERQALDEIFLWLKSQPVFPGVVFHERELGRDLHAFFGMPRRLWVAFAADGRCA